LNSSTRQAKTVQLHRIGNLDGVRQSASLGRFERPYEVFVLRFATSQVSGTNARRSTKSGRSVSGRTLINTGDFGRKRHFEVPRNTIPATPIPRQTEAEEPSVFRLGAPNERHLAHELLSGVGETSKPGIVISRSRGNSMISLFVPFRFGSGLHRAGSVTDIIVIFQRWRAQLPFSFSPP